jgi:hypothetical protein
MSQKQQMRQFAAHHKNEFTASGLASSLGWKKTKTRKGADGEPITVISHNTKAARKLAKKCGATITRGEDKVGTRTFGVFSIQFA